ncbi:MAG: aminomethyl-transferring glycine dehydrogenase subunit GcvPB [Chitinivibrionales bacterium]
MKLIFDKSVKGRRGIRLNKKDEELAEFSIPESLLREEDPELSEVSEPDAVRHFTELSRKNFGVDTNFYPLGSCTMKYNVKLLEKIAAQREFTDIHPVTAQLKQGEKEVQGSLEIMYNLERMLCEICGMDEFTLQPMAGAHGELTGMMIIAAYHKNKGNHNKTEVLIPDEAHGTNPSSAFIAGFKTRSVPTDRESGMLDINTLEEMVNENTAGIMLTNPNTLGIFNSGIRKVAEIIHRVDGLLYYDGANLNAIMGKFRPGDADFDVIHLNLHKTFGTPHGGGGPGAGPVGVKSHLKEFLPVSRVKKNKDNTCSLDYKGDKSIGYISSFYGNHLVFLRAYAYILLLGSDGLKDVSENAVLNANYVYESLKDKFEFACNRSCMHECVISGSRQKEFGVTANDIAKALIDRNIHPPTVYFPLIVKEALMTEPTETENKETLDNFISVLREIAQDSENNPEKVKSAPVTTEVKRLDETLAARNMDVVYQNT